MQPCRRSLGCGSTPAARPWRRATPPASPGRFSIAGESRDRSTQASAPSGLVYGLSVLVDYAIPASRRRLLPIQVRRALMPKRLRHVLHARAVIASETRFKYQVKFRFCEGLVQRECHPDLAKLAGQVVFDEPLASRHRFGLSPAVGKFFTYCCSSVRAAARVEDRRTPRAGQGALPVHTAVVGERLSLQSDDRQLHRVGVLSRHLEPALPSTATRSFALRVDHRTAGTCPSSSWAEPLATTSEARLDISPSPPANRVSAVATTLANRRHPASQTVMRPEALGHACYSSDLCHSTVPLG